MPNGDAGAIFVVGAPCGGTPLLRDMLNRHPRIGLCYETFYFYYVYARRTAFGELSHGSNRRRLIHSVFALKRIKQLGLDLDALGDALDRHGTSHAAFFLTLIRRQAHEGGKARFGEETPDHGMYAETLCDWYPDCRIIHLIRDPRDVVASLVRMGWGRSSILTNLQRWIRCTEGPRRIRDRDNYLAVRYEDLVDDAEKTLVRICAFIGEEYSEAMPVPDGREEKRQWMQRAQTAVTRDRVQKWRDELSPRQVAMIERVAAEQMAWYGYDPTQSAASIATVAMAHAANLLDAVRHKVTTAPRMWYHWLQPTNLAAEEAWNDRWI